MTNIVYDAVNINSRIKLMIDNAFSNHRIFPSYIFAGSNRAAKLDMAKYLSSLLNCNNETKPCGNCNNCKSIAEDKYHSFKLISKDSNQDSENDKKKKSISADDIRDIRSDIINGTFQGHLIVYVDQAEDITAVALNGLLKILEDIPEKVVFIFDVANQYSILPTIRSRSQVIIFEYAEEFDTSQELSEFISVDKFNDFIENNSVQELLIYIDAQKFERAEVREFLIKLESFYIEKFKSDGLNKFLHLSGIVRKYHLYLNRPVNVVNNLLLMFLEIKENYG